MRKFIHGRFFGLTDEAEFDIVSEDRERNAWLFVTNCIMHNAPVNYCFFDSMGMDVDVDVPRGSLGVSFYRYIDDQDGMIRLVGQRLHGFRPSSSQMLASAKRLMPNIPKSAWKTSGDKIWLENDEDKLLFQLSYGCVK